MINPNELRLGNLITSDGEIFVVDELKPDYINAGALGIYPAGFLSEDVGIPLTAEWLEKFGWNRERDLEWQYKLQDYVITILPNHVFNLWIATIYIRPLKYVHELQNCFYALSGQELQLKS